MTFPDVPSDMYQYENMFDYSVWTPNTIIRATNVPWDSSYRDIVRFDSETARDSYFESLADHTFSFDIKGMVYLRYGEPIRVNCPFSMINQCNYLVVKNPIQPVPTPSYDGVKPPRKPDVFYYFINDVQYIAPNTTQLNIQLDVWTTYQFMIKWGMCYINKGHIGIANENSEIDNLSDYLTEPEGLDIGNEYDVANVDYDSFQDNTLMVVLTTSASFKSKWGTLSDPNLSSAQGSLANGMFSGLECYALNVGDFKYFMKELSTRPWIAQCITSMQVVPQDLIKFSGSITIPGTDIKVIELKEAPSSSHVSKSFSNVSSKFDIPDRYKHLLKFYTYPYSILEMTSYQNTPLVLKPECLALINDGADFNVSTSYTQNGIRAYYYPNMYNSTGNNEAHSATSKYYTCDNKPYTIKLYNEDYLDTALCFSNFPNVGLVANNYYLYLAQNRNQIAFQYQQADWSQQKAQTAAQLAYNQASSNIGTAQNITSAQNRASWQYTDVNNQRALVSGVEGMVTSGIGAVSSGASGSAGGAVSGLANTAIAGVNMVMNQQWNNANTTTQTGLNSAINQYNVGNMQYQRDTNYDYAMYASKGDYETAIAGIQAKVQDAQMISPSVVGQQNGDTFNLVNGLLGVHFKWKRIKTNYINQIGDFWLRYGYYINRWITPPSNLKCMENFTYWKMQSASLFGDLPELFKESIRGIFEKGVTVWNDPYKINRIDLADNDPVEGIRY